MINYVWILFGILSSASAQMLLKKTSTTAFKDIMFYVYFCAAGICYVVSFGLYTLALRHFPITKISPAMTLGTMMTVIVLGLFMFHETISIKQLIGIALGVAAVTLIVS